MTNAVALIIIGLVLFNAGFAAAVGTWLVLKGLDIFLAGFINGFLKGAKRA